LLKAKVIVLEKLKKTTNHVDYIRKDPRLKLNLMQECKKHSDREGSRS